MEGIILTHYLFPFFLPSFLHHLYTLEIQPIWIAYIYFPLLGGVLALLCCVSCQDPGLMERVTDEGKGIKDRQLVYETRYIQIILTVVDLVVLEAGEGGWFWNEQVGSFRPPGALYCRECAVLIQDYDHLCPWTGTGIGRNNLLAFRVFVVGVNVLCYFSIGLVAALLLWGLAGDGE